MQLEIQSQAWWLVPVIEALHSQGFETGLGYFMSPDKRVWENLVLFRDEYPDTFLHRIIFVLRLQHLKPVPPGTEETNVALPQKASR